ncbi:MAG: hypothetical protein IJ659_02920 [Alloprevotella sp.]|nr:hypothetical protein [Alloprevotella sp.]
MKRIYAVTLLALCAACLSAQTAQERLRGFVRNVETFARLFPQEKAYLHLDNTGYFIGDTIWYKAYVVRPDTMAFTNLSGVLYVELVDPFGEIIETQKLKIEDGQCHGDISLEKLRANGFYEIRAYTRYMTNWPAENIFSRVVPVFDRPEQEGNYTNQIIEQDFMKYRMGNDTPDSLSRKQLRLWQKEKPPIVDFYPEGGNLVRGLNSLVAFEVSLPDSANIDIEGELQTEQGEVLASVRTLREGRGTFTCTPGDAPLYLCFTHDGQSRRVRLPEAQDQGCVLAVNALDVKYVSIQVNVTPDLSERELGLTLMHNGTVLAFERGRASTARAWNIRINRLSLPAGIHQLTLFDSDGRIWAQRHFFVPPTPANPSKGVANVKVCVADTLITPHKRMLVQLEGFPKQTVSVSVRDVAATTNGCDDNVATYLLLTSDLKGYVRDAEYYLEADDNAHRQAADLLCLVQGWARYDWLQMSGKAPFVKRQPIEDRLYIDGRINPKLDYKGSFWTAPRKKRNARNRASVELSVIMTNADTTVTERGRTLTDEEGYFAFSVPDVYGVWDTSFITKRKGKNLYQIASLNRQFSPPCRSYSWYEQTLPPPTPSPLHLRAEAEGYRQTEEIGLTGSKAWRGNKEHELEAATVTAHHHPTRRGTRRRLMERSQIYFDMFRETDKYLDHGLSAPYVSDWLLSHETFRRAFYEERRGIVWAGGVESGVSLYPAKSYTYSQGGYIETVNYDKDCFSQAEPIPSPRHVERNSGAPPLTIDDLDQEAYVLMDHGVTDFMRTYEVAKISRHDPFHVFIYRKGEPQDDVRASHGIRRTYFIGYNRPSTYHVPQYLVPPEEPTQDFRRTLYWNPDVLLDDNGEAIVEFYNNSTCRSITVSAEGVTADGRPMVITTNN